MLAMVGIVDLRVSAFPYLARYDCCWPNSYFTPYAYARNNIIQSSSTILCRKFRTMHRNIFRAARTKTVAQSNRTK